MTNISPLWAIPGLLALGIVTVISVRWLYKNSKPVPSLTREEVISAGLTCMQSDEQQRKIRCKICKLADICTDRMNDK